MIKNDEDTLWVQAWLLVLIARVEIDESLKKKFMILHSDGSDDFCLIWSIISGQGLLHFWEFQALFRIRVF
jgi:hypothetical protein